MKKRKEVMIMGEMMEEVIDFAVDEVEAVEVEEVLMQVDD